MAFKQRKQARSTKNKYLKPGALAQIRYNRCTNKVCEVIGKKRVLLMTEKPAKNSVKLDSAEDCCVATPVRSVFSAFRLVKEFRQRNIPRTPKTPSPNAGDNLSILESLPMDLLVKIMCHLHHDQLKAVFHVSKRIQDAVILAREIYFNFTTPDRTRQEMLMTMTPLPTQHWPFLKGVKGSSPRTPKAPRQVLRRSRLQMMDMKQIAAALFQESSWLPKKPAPRDLGPVVRTVASNRALIYEEELCQAVSKNKLL